MAKVPGWRRFRHGWLGVRGFTLLLVLVAVVPPTIFMIYQAFEDRRDDRAQAEGATLRLARSLAQQQQLALQWTEAQLGPIAQLMANTEDLSTIAEACAAFFRPFVGEEGVYSDIGVVDARGGLICNPLGPADEPLDLSAVRGIADALSSGEFSVGGYEFNPATGDRGFSTAYPIRGADGVHGALFAFLDPAALSASAASVDLPAGGSVTVVDQMGTVVARYPDPAAWVGRSLADLENFPRLGLGGPPEAGSAEFDLDGTATLTSFAPLGPDGALRLLVGLPKSTVYADGNSALRSSIIAAAIVGAIALTLAWTAAWRFLLVPLAGVTAITDRVREADLTARARRRRSPVEIRRLNENVNRMAATLERQQELEDRALLRGQMLADASGALASASPRVYGEVAELLVPGLADAASLCLADGDERPGSVYTAGEAALLAVPGLPPQSWTPGRTWRWAAEVEQGRVAADPRLADFIEAPLISERETLGSLRLARAAGSRAFDGEEQAFVVVLASRIGSALANAALLRDLQDLNRDLEDRVARRTEALEDANRELESFSYSVSHDLRAPLRAIDGFSQIIQQDYSEDLPEGARTYLARVRDGTARMRELIDDLLRLSRAGRHTLQRRQVEPRPIVEELVRDLSANGGRPVRAEIGELPPCDADPALLRQVWHNLLENAWKFSQPAPAPRVEVGGAVGPDGLPRYWVRDNGVGFEMEYADKLFGVFQRLHTSEFPGTGVGLAIVQQIVRRHGGEVRAESTPGETTEFSFTIGRAEDDG